MQLLPDYRQREQAGTEPNRCIFLSPIYNGKYNSKMNINDLRKHVRGIISERIYSNGGLTPDYEAIYNDFMQSVEKQGGIKSDNGSPLTELEGTAFVFGENYEFEFDYEVYNRQFVKASHGDNYNEPEYEELGGDFDFAITNAKVMDKEGDFVCDFDEIAERFDDGYDTVKEWFVFDESEMIDPLNEELNELTPHQKQRNIKDVERFFRKGKKGFNGIRTIVVMTAENPDTQKAPNQDNKKARHSLLSNIKNGGYAYVPAMGKFGNTERPYAVFNMSVDTAKLLCGKYQQTSFVYSALNEDGSVHSEYWEKQNPTQPYDKFANDYIKKDECDTWDDMSDADDNFTVVGKHFKYSIPFDIFNSVDETIGKNITQLAEFINKKSMTPVIKENLLGMTINGVGYSAYLWRKAATKGLHQI
jgi:hypothetical protein